MYETLVAPAPALVPREMDEEPVSPEDGGAVLSKARNLQVQVVTNAIHGHALEGKKHTRWLDKKVFLSKKSAHLYFEFT